MPTLITYYSSVISAISPAGTPTAIEIGEGDFNVASTFSAINSTRIGNISIKGQGMGITNLLAKSTITGTNKVITISGSVGTSRNLTVNGSLGAATVTVSTANSATFTVGDTILVRSSKAYGTATSSTSQQGEIHKIRAVNTGTGVITLDSWLQDTYNTADTANIAKISTISNFTLEGFTIKADTGFTSTGIMLDLQFCDNLNVKDIEVIDCKGQFASGIKLTSCTNFNLDHVVPHQTQSNTFNEQYGVYLGSACQNGFVFLQAKGLFRHSFTTGGISGDDYAGAVRSVTITGTSEATNQAHFDTHADSDGITFLRCTILAGGYSILTSDSSNGFASRSKNTKIIGCDIGGAVGAGIALSEDSHNTLVSGNTIHGLRLTQNGVAGYCIRTLTGTLGTVITGNTVVDCNSAFGIWLQSGNNDTVISGNIIKNVTGTAIRGTAALDVVVTGNRINNGAGKAIEMTSTSDYWVITGNSARSSAASTIIGANTVKADNTNL